MGYEFKASCKFVNMYCFYYKNRFFGILLFASLIFVNGVFFFSKL